MGTRLLSEHLIKTYHPQFRYVRAHTTGKNAATLYVWNENLELAEAEARSVERFADQYLAPYVCFRVKPYRMLQEDGVPGVGELPERIVQAAMKRDLDQYGVVSVIREMIGGGSASFHRYDMISGTLHFNVRTGKALTAIERELLHRYVSEIISLGTRCEIDFLSEDSRSLSG